MLKQLIWIGSSLKDLNMFPEDVKDEIGYILYLVQNKEHHSNIKPLKGFSGGVMEIKTDYDKDTYRTVFVSQLGNEIYVLHVFKKKSKRGIKTPKEELEVIAQRLKRAQEIALNKKEK
ncbi:MAG: type II toxin-antitoxin system RelE/ParE family toxin [Gammaproteobacteria bacterium]|nr:type II toxin-antitoxin system RelE/ParE family toxin [Gammaproteobacteria bacterium]